jgi:predicted nucleotidyltransferase
MDSKTISALKWIATILNDSGIPYRMGGGAATNLYGSGRPVNDIDISMAGKEYFSVILPLVKEYIVTNPTHYQDEKWDCVTLSLNYHGQDIDITDSETLLMRSKDNTHWIENKYIYRKYPDVVREVDGVPVSLMDPRVLLEYKQELTGDHQEFDRKFLEQYIQSNDLKVGQL